MDTHPKPANQRERFITAAIELCQRDKGAAAHLRRADNPATEYQSWEYLAGWGVDLEKPWQRLPYTTLAAAIARAKPEHNGKLPLAQAIAYCYDEGKQSDQARAKLRRLLACDTLEELCLILRASLRLIESRVSQPLDYLALLNDLVWYHHNPEAVRSRWAQQFYRRHESDGAAA
jgi:CRISPR system Cascade subunit CasB